MNYFSDLSTRLREAAAPLTRSVEAAQTKWQETLRAHRSRKGDDIAESQQLIDNASGDESSEGFAVAGYLKEEYGDDGKGLLSIHNLAKSYKARRVVEDVSLHVRRGEAVGLLGPNGAGKTTVFYMITGLVKPDKGMISLDGYDVTALPMYRRARLGIGYLPQEASIFRGLSVEDNIRAVLEITTSFSARLSP